MTPISVQEIEAFLIREAELLDRWALEEWVALFTKDCAYLVPASDLPDDASPRTTLFYIADNHHRLSERAKRLMKRTAYAESPRAKMRRMISNIRYLGEEGDTIRVACNFVAVRTKLAHSAIYVGHIHYRLRRENGHLKIQEKRVLLDQDGLNPNGRITAPL